MMHAHQTIKNLAPLHQNNMVGSVSDRQLLRNNIII